MQDAVPASRTAEPCLDEPVAALPLRNDTILGVCEAIGQDFGFNPLWLRLLFAALFYLNPLLVSGTYLALGGGVALSRWLYPVAAIAAPPHPAEQLEARAPANQADCKLSLAA